MAILSSSLVKMTSVLEKIVAIIAPHRCIVCSNYNNMMCNLCAQKIPHIKQPFCVLCGKAASDWHVCIGCSQTTSLSRVWVRGIYDGSLKDLIHKYKFEHARDAYKPIAATIADILPSLDSDWSIVPVPTVASHIRERSYDHAKLVARQVAKLKGVQFAALLERTKNTRQVGATRVERTAVAASIALKRAPDARKILLIDDVCTTGATLSACAEILKRAGAREVCAVVAAWQPSKKDTKKDR